MSIIRSISALICLLFINLPNTYAQTALDDYLTGLTTLYAQFEQKLYSESGELLEASRGELFIERPNQFRWDYQQPYQQLIIADGEQIWIYEADLAQVTVKPMSKALDKTPALLLSSDSHLAENFRVTPLPNTDTQSKYQQRFLVEPKAEQSQFVRLHISLLRNELQTFELIDNLGQTTLIMFRQARRNEQFAPNLFHFTPPAGTDIITD